MEAHDFKKEDDAVSKKSAFASRRKRICGHCRKEFTQHLSRHMTDCHKGLPAIELVDRGDGTLVEVPYLPRF